MLKTVLKYQPVTFGPTSIVGGKVVTYSKRSIINFSSEEMNLVVDVHKQSVSRFTDKNLKMFKEHRKTAAYPRVFGSSNSLLKYVEPRLINVSEIDQEKDLGSIVWFTQLVRAGINPVEGKVRENIEDEGYSLVGPYGIMVMKMPNGKYICIDGRTRLKFLIGDCGMKNIIVDVFEYPGKNEEWKVLVFGIFMNNINKPYGEVSFNDIQKGIRTLIEQGYIPKLDDSEEGKQEMKDIVRKQLGEMQVANKLTESQTNTIIMDAIDRLTGIHQVLSFPNGKDAPDWLEKNNYKDDADSAYVPFAMVKTHVAHKKMVTAAADPKYKNVKEIRLVGYVGVLDADNPERDWKDRTNFKENLIRYEESLIATRFVGASRKSPKVILYGLIPMVYSLEEKYPMNFLYVYDKDSAEG